MRPLGYIALNHFDHRLEMPHARCLIQHVPDRYEQSHYIVTFSPLKPLMQHVSVSVRGLARYKDGSTGRLRWMKSFGDKGTESLFAQTQMAIFRNADQVTTWAGDLTGILFQQT